MIGTYSDYVTGNEENPTETLMEKLQHRQVKSIFTPDVFYDSNQPEPLIGFKDVRMAQFDSSFLVISRQNDGSTRIDLIEAKGIGQEGFKLLHDQPGDIYEPIINEDDLMENIKTQIPGTVLFVANGDPGHSVIVADENGSVYIYSGVGETETNRVNGTIIH